MSETSGSVVVPPPAAAPELPQKAEKDAAKPIITRPMAAATPIETPKPMQASETPSSRPRED